ncbi:hypothetical protein VTO42DRAFT_2825 [Malbranchea cinnamomea]
MDVTVQSEMLESISTVQWSNRSALNLLARSTYRLTGAYTNCWYSPFRPLFPALSLHHPLSNTIRGFRGTFPDACRRYLKFTQRRRPFDASLLLIARQCCSFFLVPRELRSCVHMAESHSLIISS